MGKDRTLEIIKTEIERRKGYISVTHFAEELLSFLSTLESEKPMNQDELEKEIEKYFPESAFNTGFNYDDMQDIARHFAKWQKEQDEEEQADLFTIVALDAAQRAKNKMMEDAKEGKIIFLLNGDVAVNIGDTDEYKLGQKVRIIIVKD